MNARLVVLAAFDGEFNVFGQECIRPEWGKCVSFPNGGSHTGTSIQKKRSSRKSRRSRYLRESTRRRSALHVRALWA